MFLVWFLNQHSQQPCKMEIIFPFYFAKRKKAFTRPSGWRVGWKVGWKVGEPEPVTCP